MTENYREASRLNWKPSDGTTMTTDRIGVGCLQRIADAVEKMASSYDSMRRDRDRHKDRADLLEKEGQRMARRISALQGVITKMKRTRAAAALAKED